jgi:hypothetical protein
LFGVLLARAHDDLGARFDVADFEVGLEVGILDVIMCLWNGFERHLIWDNSEYGTKEGLLIYSA